MSTPQEMLAEYERLRRRVLADMKAFLDTGADPDELDELAAEARAQVTDPSAPWRAGWLRRRDMLTQARGEDGEGYRPAHAA